MRGSLIRMISHSIEVCIIIFEYTPFFISTSNFHLSMMVLSRCSFGATVNYLGLAKVNELAQSIRSFPNLVKVMTKLNKIFNRQTIFF